MKCKSCSTEIPPTFVHCIQTNSCPMCGKLIIPDNLKVLMDTIRESITNNDTTAEELIDWLVSTYNIPIKNTAVTKTTHTGELRWANSPTHEFAKNAGVNKIKQNSELAAIAQAVNNINNDLYGGEPISTEYPEEVEEAPRTPEQIEAELTAAAVKKGGKLTLKEAKNILSGEDNLYLDENGNTIKPMIDNSNSSEIEAAAGIIKNMFTADQSPVLQDERLKRLRSQYSIQNGSSGSFRRG